MSSVLEIKQNQKWIVLEGNIGNRNSTRPCLLKMLVKNTLPRWMNCVAKNVLPSTLASLMQKVSPLMSDIIYDPFPATDHK